MARMAWRASHGRRLADYDRSGRAHMLVGNFSNQMLVFITMRAMAFVDEAPISSVGRDSLFSLTFGVFFFDSIWTATPTFSRRRTYRGRDRARAAEDQIPGAPYAVFTILVRRNSRTCRAQWARLHETAGWTRRDLRRFDHDAISMFC